MATGGSSFISKPARGWLHPDHLVSKEGITYTVKYIGCLEVYTSMKSLDFETRSCVAKECINRVCEAAGLKSADKKRRVDRKVLRAIADKPRMEHTGATINLTISSCSLALTNIETGYIIAKHEMPRISFASGGDTEILDFVAYVAKNMQEWRACYVLECGGGLAQDVISTIGQAFELRFKEFLTKPAALHPMLNGIREADRDYYNDLPGKVPPDIGPPPVPPLPTTVSTLPNLKHHHSGQNHTSRGNAQNSGLHDTFSSNPDRHHQQWAETGNLIDLNSDGTLTSTNFNIPPEHNYVNDSVIAATRESHRDQTSLFDVFDMQPFSSAISDMNRLSPHSQKQQLKQEIWFHGSVSRAEAESMLTRDGDFLVRESQGSPGQYVLTGMNNNTPKHLLLIDPEGVVRTKDRVFDSVSHLVNHHCDNVLPIISADSVLVLRYPIPRRTTN
ncbi:SHC-adaptor protein [Osmia lignaria lignaria]|uniref:SHC-transforming protein 1 n=1 Tax=Osmia bicornis bicornis TaxID=1437191 RepID=UPI0010F95721|nr:SHC-transforming protein 1 [Osmia bicornis bicornis]XP_029042441.1 SHC-transforming protein 1 [Osmia bicornis bicornis]XP_029042442.1 SHC-transforming protein 1 [Osmia bicornis bicornis]XP_034176455.1 SHC-transforming protein 1 [Osmia lignaria]XP_034176456.1 SHC-transforming protein 1 [Osmia lignaria]XP_034176458.1 SHC-transforming protein 1 [Osmia lignaria]